MVGLACQYANTWRGFVDIDACHDEESGSKVDRESNSNVADYEAPTTYPRGDFAVSGGRNHEGLVVDTTTGGVNTGNLAEGSGNGEDDEGYSEPAPDDVGRATTNYRIVKGSCQTVRDGSQNEGHEGDLGS